MRKIEGVPASLKEIWEIKEKAFNEIKNLNIKSAIKKRLSSSKMTSSKLGFILTRPSRKTVIKKAL